MITSLRLQNFRSYRDESFEFNNGVNIVVGPNASGKTNLLEAVLVLSQGKSYRAKDQELVMFGKPWSRLDGFFGKHSRAVKLEPDKSYLLDDKPYKRLGFDKTVPLVLFEPNHLQLATRGPEHRRDFFDDLLERSQPGYKPLLANYKRTLAQRNSLLKQNPVQGRKQLFAWNIRLSELGGKVASARQELVDDINKKISRTYSRIAQHRSKVALEVDSQFPADNYSSRMLDKLEKNTAIDFERGFTAHGPHRDDIVFYLDKQLAGVAASRGEARSLLLGLKIYELELIEKARGRKPIFLLDDVFSELDGARRLALVDYLKDYQTIITTTDADSVLAHFTEGPNLIAIK